LRTASKAVLDKTWCRYDEGAPPIFWLPGFFFAQSFFTAALQNYARARSMPIDVVAYGFEMLSLDPSSHTAPPAEGVYVHGLFLEGAGWDAGRRQLCEAAPRALFTPAPCVYLRPHEASEVPVTPSYSCPLYRTAERKGTLATTGHSTNFVMFVQLPSDVAEAHWVLRGAALLCQLSD
jgi:dynein heavy chain, axonemal